MKKVKRRKNKEELCVAPARLKLESPRQARDRLASELQILTASDGTLYIFQKEN